MKGILADVNIQGQVDQLVAMIQADPWVLFWNDLSLKYVHFSDVGLVQDSPDSLVWETCQNLQFVLITDNRNRRGPDSLEATIQNRNTVSCLPVFTIANVPHLSRSRDYANRVLDRFFDFLMRIESLRGTGRLFLP